MNKYITLMIVLVALIASGVIYRSFLIPDSQKPVDTGSVKEFTITILKNSWVFEPEHIYATRGDTVKMKFVNEDEYDHGVGIDAYGVSQRIPARATLDVPPFVVTKAGNFQFYCSVSCNEGVAESGKYKGQKRSHFDQIGVLHVNEIGVAPKIEDDTVAIIEPAGPTPPVVVLAQKSLAAELKIGETNVKIVSFSAITWSNGCLDIPFPEGACTAALVPGYRVVLEAGDKKYEYHTDEKADVRMLP